MMPDLKHLSQLIARLRATSSNKTKAQILKSTLQAIPQLERYLQMVYDPHRQFYLSSDVAMGHYLPVAKNVGDYPVRSLCELLHAFEKRQITGHKACHLWCAMLARLGSDDALSVANAILDKDLKCRLGIKTVNTVLEDLGRPLIPVFEVALGKPWEGQEVWKEDDETWYASRKLDGIRCLALLSQGKPPQLLSRTGIAFTSLATLSTVLSSYVGPDVVLDGELALGMKESCHSDDFQGIMKQIHRKDHDITSVVFHVFDLIPLDEFEACEGDTPFKIRQARLIKTVAQLNSWHVVRVPQHKLDPAGDVFQAMLEFVESQGWEGLILRKAAPYVGERSTDIYKVKQMHDLEARVVAIETGPFEVVEAGRSATITTMTAAVIAYKGTTVNVGSGWSLKQRKRFYWNPEQLVGQVITVQFFEETKNQEGKPSLRFPVMKALHGASRTV